MTDIKVSVENLEQFGEQIKGFVHARFTAMMTVLQRLEEQRILPKDYVQTVLDSFGIHVPTQPENETAAFEPDTEPVFDSKAFADLLTRSQEHCSEFFIP